MFRFCVHFFGEGGGIAKNLLFAVVVDALRRRRTGDDKRRPIHELIHRVNKRGASGINI